VSIARLAFVSFVVMSSGSISAQLTPPPSAGYATDVGIPASAIPAPLREVGFDQNLNQRVPLDIQLRAEDGRTVALGEYFGTKPVVLAFVYYECPMLCSQVLNALTGALSTLSLDAGTDFDVVAVSFDPRESPSIAAAKKANYLKRYARPGTEAGWHFLTGDQDAIDRITKAAGFRYVWDEATKQFAHPAGVIVLTPDGRLARYLFGIEYGPRDLRLALVEASEGTVGSPVDSLLLYCYHYDPATGRYGFVVMRAIRIAGAGTVLALGTFITIALRKERKR
jgi:protein SCO1/2